MSIQASMRFFGSSNYTMDMTPSRFFSFLTIRDRIDPSIDFWIKPDFNVETLSSTNLKVSLQPWNFTAPVLCQGNVTRDDSSRSPHEVRNASRTG